ncbi:pre-mRNA processing factor 3-domain-containing protein [Tuber indicum]|nr:pre-mRNA processing factor 3-domain-containing protein [Tuber indicum]
MHAVRATPNIEWWDQDLTAASSYEAITLKFFLISAAGTIITLCVECPVLIAPPPGQTKKEQKKSCRQRCADALKEQVEVCLGLEAPPLPKIKKSNLMRVLGGEVVKDPTAVEARMNRQIKERHKGRLKANEKCKLTNEQHQEKLAATQENDLARGIHFPAFRIETLENGRHRYKININTEQLASTGNCVLNRKFNLVIVEGRIYSITKFRKLMMNKIGSD